MKLVTGANGFVGKALIEELRKRRYETRGTVRTKAGDGDIIIGDINSTTNWADALNRVDSIIHLAARVHVMNDTAQDPLKEFRRVNVEGTLRLARQAAEIGVKRFIFLSSIKVNGEGFYHQNNSSNTDLSAKVYRADDVALATDPYGISKMEAEEGLKQIASETGIEIVIIRPPLVYGPGVKANFRRLLMLLNRGIPLPFANIENKRSMVYLGNLVDLIILCVEHPAAANQTFLVSDGEDLSTSDLLRRIGSALSKPARLFSFHQKTMFTLAKILGKQDVVQRLFCSLQIDIDKNKKILNWIPPSDVETGLRVTVQDFQKLENLEK